MKFIFTLILLSGTVLAQTWTQLSDLPDQGRDDGVAVTVNNTAFFGTGLKTDWSYGRDFYKLDPSNNSWTPIASMPTGAQRQYACAFAGAGCFYVFAGDGVGGSLNNLYKYDLLTDNWLAVTPKPGSGVLGASCMAFGDKVIIVGGKFQGSGTANSEVWEYTLSTDSWQQKANFPFGGRFRASSTVLSNTGYLAFGLDETNRFRKGLYSYAPGNDTWTALGDFPQTYGRAYASLNSLNNKLILFGGVDSLNTYHKDVWYFDPATAGWSQSADFASFGRKGGMAAVIGNRFYYSGGINVSDTRLNETWMLDLPVGIAGHTLEETHLYPNPFSDVLFFESQVPSGNKIRFDFVNSYGQEIESIQKRASGKGTEALSISHLPEGIYFLAIYMEEALITTTRIIKN